MPKMIAPYDTDQRSKNAIEQAAVEHKPVGWTLVYM